MSADFLSKFTHQSYWFTSLGELVGLDKPIESLLIITL